MSKKNLTAPPQYGSPIQHAAYRLWEFTQRLRYDFLDSECPKHCEIECDLLSSALVINALLNFDDRHYHKELSYNYLSFLFFSIARFIEHLSDNTENFQPYEEDENYRALLHFSDLERTISERVDLFSQIANRIDDKESIVISYHLLRIRPFDNKPGIERIKNMASLLDFDSIDEHKWKLSRANSAVSVKLEEIIESIED